MGAAKEFGRRRTPVQSRARAEAHPDPLALSAEAEDFRRSLGSAFVKKPDAFAVWWRGQIASRMLLWMLNAALIAPGPLFRALGAGWAVSFAAEVVGVGLAFWLRRERRRRLSAIAQWTGELGPGAGAGAPVQ